MARTPYRRLASAPPALSVVLACYDEEETLVASFAEIQKTLEELGQPYEIIFVDDHSRDRTRDLIQSLVASHPDLQIQVLLHERNLGRGASVRDGFRAARGSIVGYLDVDLEVHARYIPSVVAAILKGADVATVQRIRTLEIRSLDRFLMSRGYSWLVRRLLGVDLKDTETGFKFFRRERVLGVLDEIQDPGWFWDTEFMVRSARHGFKIEEVPGAYVRRYDKTSTVRGLRDSVGYFKKLLSFRRSLRKAPRPAAREFPAQAHRALAAVRPGHFWFENRRRALGSVLHALELPAPGRVLEVGCGDGHLLSVLPGRFRVGLDLHPEDLGQARRAGFDLVVAGSALRLPFRGRFSLICLFDVIEHADDDVGLLRECASLLEPGGWLVLSTPSSPRLWSHLDVFAGHRRRYRRNELRGVLAESGLVFWRQFPLFRALWPLAWAQAHLARGREVADPAREFSVGRLANGALRRLLALEWSLLGSSPLGWGTSWCAVASRPREPPAP